MPLQEQHLAVQFRGGLETKLDEKIVPLGKWIEAKNAVFTRGGIGAKRYGYEALSAEIAQSATSLVGRSLAKRGTELLCFTDDELYTFQGDAAKWVKVGDVESVPLSHRVAVKTTSEQTLADMDELDGIAVYAWEDSRGGVYYAVEDADAGALLQAPTQIDANGERPRVHRVGARLHIYWMDTSNHWLRVGVVNPAEPTIAPAAANLFEDVSTSIKSYDVDTVTISAQERAVLAYSNDAGWIVVAWVHTSGAVGSPANGLESPITITTLATVTGTVGVAADQAGSNELIVLWNDSPNQHLRWTALASDLTTVVSPNLLAKGFLGAADNLGIAFQTPDDANGERRAHLFYEERGSPTQDSITYARILTTAGTEGSETTYLGRALASKPFRDGGHVYIWTVHETTLFTTYLLQRDDGLIVARVLSATAGGVTAKAHLGSVKDDPDDSNQKLWAGIYREDLESANNDVYTERGIRRIVADFDDSQSHQTAELGRSLYISGGMLQIYDGRQVLEADFHMAPDDVSAPSQASPAGDGVDVGTHTYRFTYERTLANGEIQLSAVSAGTTVVVSGSAKKVTFSIPTYRFGDGTERIGVWRSEAGVSAKLHRVSSLDPTATGVNGYVQNDPTVDTVSFADEMSDANLLNQEPLYTTGGILSNDPIAVSAVLTAGKGRLYSTVPGDEDVIQFTQERREGYTVEASPRLRLRVPSRGGMVTGAVEMDDKLVVFKETAIYFVAGQGPLANPDGGLNFSPPQLVPTDVGCSDARSIGLFPMGAVFQSAKGIHLLDRGMQVHYLGRPVERFTDPARGNQTVVATTLTDDRREIRMLCSSGESLLYDYEHDSWGSWLNHVGRDAVVVDGVYHYLRSDGIVWKETVGLYQDGTSQIRGPIYRTPHFKLTELLGGFQRLWWLHIVGTYKSAHTLRVRAFYDYEAGHDDEWIFDPSTHINLPGYGEGDYGEGDYGEGAGGQPVSRYELEAHVGSECAAVQFEFEFLEATGDAGAAGELTEMVLIGGVLGRRHPLVDERRA